MLWLMQPMIRNYVKRSQTVENYYSAMQYKVRLDMSIGTFYQTLENLRKKGNVNEHTRTIMHEYGHWLQFQATPFGMYLESLLEQSSWILVRLIQTLLNKYGRKHAISLPLLSMFENIPEINNDQEILKLLYDWIDLQSVLYYQKSPLWDYHEAIDELNTVRNDATRSFVSSYIIRADNTLAKNYAKLPEADFVYRPAPNLMYQPDKLKNAMDSELQITKFRTAMGISANSMFEGFSTAVEWCLSPEEFYLPSPIPADLSDYLLIISAISSVFCNSACGKSQLLNTCAAVFDVIFSLPVLPQLSSLRSEEFSLCDFDVNARFNALFYLLRQTGPICEGETLENYEKKLCDALQWAEPRSIAKEAAEHFTPIPSDPVTNLFVRFQQKRLEGFWPFFDRKALLCSSDMPFPPVVECNDEIIIDHGYNDELSFVMRDLIRKFAAQALLSERIILEFPYRMSDHSRNLYRTLLWELLGKMGINIRLEDLQIK